MGTCSCQRFSSEVHATGLSHKYRVIQLWCDAGVSDGLLHVWLPERVPQVSVVLVHYCAVLLDRGIFGAAVCDDDTYNRACYFSLRARHHSSDLPHWLPGVKYPCVLQVAATSLIPTVRAHLGVSAEAHAPWGWRDP